MERRDAVIALLMAPFSTYAQEINVTVPKDSLSVVTNPDFRLQIDLDRISALEVSYKGETIKFTAKEVMDALRG